MVHDCVNVCAVIMGQKKAKRSFVIIIFRIKRISYIYRLCSISKIEMKWLRHAEMLLETESIHVVYSVLFAASSIEAYIHSSFIDISSRLGCAFFFPFPFFFVVVLFVLYSHFGRTEYCM